MGQFSGLILILLLLAFFLRVDFIFYVIYVSVGIFAWGRWLMPRATKNLQSHRLYDRQAFWGEVVPVTIELTNNGRLPCLPPPTAVPSSPTSFFTPTRHTAVPILPPYSPLTTAKTKHAAPSPRPFGKYAAPCPTGPSSPLAIPYS